MSHVSTRIATLSDLDCLAALFDAYRQFYKQETDPALCKNFVQARIQKGESVVVLALNEAQKAVGFCQLYPSFCSVEAKPIYSLYDLFVSTESRLTGVGKALLLAAEKIAIQNGMARMDLTTAKTNAPAQAMYESMGWVKDEIFYTYSKSV
jgi:ribosomal protein S18 acetylase RimI-like enzyme